MGVKKKFSSTSPCCFLFFLFFVFAPSLWAETLRPYSADYRVELNGFKIGEMQRTLHYLPVKKTYRLISSLRTTGMTDIFKRHRLKESVEIGINTTGLRPLLYQRLQDDRGDIEEESLNFTSSGINSLKNGRAFHFKPPIDDLWDPLGFQLQLRLDLAQNRAPLNYNIAKKEQIKSYQFSSEGKEWIETSAGRFLAEAVVRVDSKGRKTVFWCAEQLDYLLVKIEQQGGSYDVVSTLTKFRWAD